MNVNHWWIPTYFLRFLKGCIFRIFKQPEFFIRNVQFPYLLGRKPFKVHLLRFRSPRRIFHPPSWQRVSDFIYVYSAFCSRTPDSNDICATVTILAIATQESLGRNDLEKMTCQLWFVVNCKSVIFSLIKYPFLKTRYDSSIQPISVPVTVAETTNREAKVLTCESKYASVMPFGVSLGIPEPKKGTPQLHYTRFCK